MRRLILVLFAASMVLGIASQAMAYGEPVNGFPSWYERMVHVLTNRARADPQAFLTACTDERCPDRACYDGPRPAVFWDERLNRAARFHADHLVATSAGMQHDSPCDLSPTIGTEYPDTCNGATACACFGGSLSCAGACPRFSERVGLFGVSTWAENIASRGDPYSILDQWLLEDGSDASCQWTYDKGHRWSILNPQLTTLGVGGSSSYTVQDFGSGTINQKIPAGGHYPESGTSITYLANWYDTQAPSLATVNVGGTCFPMTVEFGTDTNGTFAYSGVASGCTHYYFLFKDANGTEIHYPSVGSFGVGCDQEWYDTTPAAGSGCACTPSCEGKTCGDDGCGGSCGTCGAGLACDGASCVCAFASCGADCCAETEVCAQGICCQPQCDGLVCGDNGCGGTCGSCALGEVCESGRCACSPGFADCGAGSCVSLDTASHCGACDVVCPLGDICANGICAGECPADATQCDTSCIDTLTNPLHCGGCDIACLPNQVCDAGVCTTSMGEDTTPSDVVGGDTVNPPTDTHIDNHDTESQSDLTANDAANADAGSRTLISDGCGCQMHRPVSSKTPWMFALVVGLILARRRRHA